MKLKRSWRRPCQKANELFIFFFLYSKIEQTYKPIQKYYKSIKKNSSKSKTTQQWVNQTVHHPSSCVHEAQIASIIASLDNDKHFYVAGRGANTGWFERTVDGPKQVDGNHIWLMCCTEVHELLLNACLQLRRAEDADATYGEHLAAQRYIQRIKRVDKTLSTGCCNRVHALLQRMLVKSASSVA